MPFGGPRGGGQFLMSEVPLQDSDGGVKDLVFGAIEGHGVREGEADVGHPLGLGGVCSLLQLRAHRLLPPPASNEYAAGSC